MALQAPNLDDRKFQDIVREARTKIPLYCPQWTDYNLSDPGVTLIELFAWMVDMLLFRLNRVPEKNYIKFMDLIGVRLEPPRQAKAEVTFRLSAPQPEATVIPMGTEIATVRTETQAAISFTTDEDLTVLIPTLAFAMITPDDKSFADCLPALKNPDMDVSVFEEMPKEDNALYLGYTEDLRSHRLILTVGCTIYGVGVSSTNPPLAWEYWDGELERWLPVMLESDGTGGLNANGQIILNIPSSSSMREVSGQGACWLRCRAVKPAEGQPAYSSSPKVRSLVSESLGGTVVASHALRIRGEVLGRSDGRPGQRFTLSSAPVLSRLSGETMEVEGDNEGEFEPWEEVPDFADSGPDSRHFTLDSVSGEIQLGPSVRQPTGEEKQHGMIPSAGHLIRFGSYRSGGGVVGNVGAGTIRVLKSSVPYVDSVVNFKPSIGGIDAETLERAMLRAPQALRARTRAVTADDFECLALEASDHVARAKCVTPGGDGGKALPSGLVALLLVPQVPECERFIEPDELELTKGLREQVQEFLDERRLLGTGLQIASPTYQPVVVTVHVRVKGRRKDRVAAEVEKRLYTYINPVCGGPEGKGWPFGRSLTLPEVYAVVQQVDAVGYIEDLKIVPIDTKTGERQDATMRIDISPDVTLCSHRHEIVAD